MYAFIAQATTRTAVLALILTASGCSALATQPGSAGQTSIIAGDWQRDDASSDDFDSKLAQVLRERQQRLRARHGAGASRRNGDEQDGGGNRGDPRYFDALEIPQEETEHFRTRMIEDLRPPHTLHIAQQAGVDAVEMRHDREAASRRYLPGQTVSRIDATGAAQIKCGWERQAFVISAQYVHRATRHWHYEVEPVTGMLLLRFEVNDPEIGHMNLVSRYRRQAP